MFVYWVSFCCPLCMGKICTSVIFVVFRFFLGVLTALMLGFVYRSANSVYFGRLAFWPGPIWFIYLTCFGICLWGDFPNHFFSGNCLLSIRRFCCRLANLPLSQKKVETGFWPTMPINTQPHVSAPWTAPIFSPKMAKMVSIYELYPWTNWYFVFSINTRTRSN